jgi:hypothetical protein
MLRILVSRKFSVETFIFYPTKIQTSVYTKDAEYELNFHFCNSDLERFFVSLQKHVVSHKGAHLIQHPVVL